MALAAARRVLLHAGSRQGRREVVDGARCFANKRVLVETDEAAGIAVMKLNNPPVNSLSMEFLTEFVISLEKLENDKTCRGVILTSERPGIFSAGLDLMEMYGRNPAHYTEFWRAVQELWLRLYLSSKILVCAINGASPAGGCLMALTCDYRIMTDNPKYTIGLNESQLGIVAPFWFKDNFVNTVGHRAAERALQLGLLFSPAEAFKLGMVDEVVPEDQVQSKARLVTAQWMAIPVTNNLKDWKRRKPPPEPTKVHIGRLTRNVTKDHIMEIFSTYGKIKMIDMPVERMHPHLSKGYAYVEFENPDEAEKALKHMDGGGWSWERPYLPPFLTETQYLVGTFGAHFLPRSPSDSH